MKEHLGVLQRLSKIPGVDVYSAQELLAEIGPGAAAFAAANQFVWWVGVCRGARNRRASVTATAPPKGIAI